MAIKYVSWSGGPSGDYICDGSADQTEINSALAWANANPGNTITLRGPHTYLINNVIRVGSSTIWNAEAGVIIKVANSAAGAYPDGTPIIGAVVGVTPSNLEIYGFEIDGNCENQSTTLGYAHGVPSSSGSGVERAIGLYGGSGTGPKISYISIHDMHFHDCFGEALHVRYGNNIKFYNCACENMQHDAIFYISVNGDGNEIHHNTIEAITDGGIRCDNCQNIKIYNNSISPYRGTNNNGAYEYGANGIQIANNSSYSQLTNGIEIYNNTFTNIDLCGIWLNDQRNSAGTTAQTVNIHNNTFTNCGATGNSSVDYGGAIAVEPWGNGITITNNIFNGSHPIAIIISSAISSTSSFGLTISSNNIINTQGKGSSGSSILTSAVGYGVYNKVNTKITATITGNYFSGNLTGNCYNCTSSNNATSSITTAGPTSDSGGGTPGGGSAGGNVNPNNENSVVPTRYVPVTNALRQDWIFDGYYVKDSFGKDRTAYVNGIPFNWQKKSVSSSQLLSQEHPAGTDGDNIGDFGEQGATLNLSCYASSVSEAFDIISTMKARTPSIIELGGVYEDLYLEGIYQDRASDIDNTDPDTVLDNVYPFSASFLLDRSCFYSKTKRVRGRKIYTDGQVWNADDCFSGNLLSNGSFESWTQNIHNTVSSSYKLSKLANWSFETWDSGTSNVAPTGWTLTSTGQSRSTDHMAGSYSYLITGNGSTAVRGEIHQTTTLTSGYYNIGAWIKIQNRTQGALSLQFFDGTSYYSEAIVVNRNTSGWEYFELRTLLPTNNLGFRLYVDGTPNNGSLWYVDAVTISQDPVTVQSVETDNGNSITKTFTYTPAGVYNPATVETQFESLPILDSEHYWNYGITSIYTIVNGTHVTSTLAEDHIYVDVSGFSAIPLTIVVSLAYSNALVDVPMAEAIPAGWAGLSLGIGRENLGDQYGALITGDGVTWSPGALVQYPKPEAGITYVLSATAYTENLTSGYLEVVMYANNTIYKSLIWDQNDTSKTQKQVYVFFETLPQNVAFVIHTMGTPNEGALFHIDNAIFEKASDFEIGATGNLITTFGSLDAVPDIEISSSYMKSSSTSVGQQIIYNSGYEAKTSASTVYSSEDTSLELTATLRQLPAGNQYRIDEVFTNLGTSHSGTKASMKVTVQIPSLNNGNEKLVAEWSDSSHIPTNYNSFKKELSILAASTDTVTIRYYLKTADANYRAAAQRMGYKFSVVSTVKISGGVSIYNTADPLTLMRLCNNLRPNFKIGINANYTGYHEYSDTFIDSTFLDTVLSSSGVTYDSSTQSITIASGGSLVYPFDCCYPVTGIPFIKMYVVSGAPIISISTDNTNWHLCDGNSTTNISNAYAERQLNDNSSLFYLKGNSVFYLKIAPNTGTNLTIGSIFTHADLNTLDCQRIKLRATGQPESLCALLDAPANVIITTKFTDRYPVV